MKTVKCNNMAELKEAIKEKVNLDLTNWTDGDINLQGAITGDIYMRNAKTGNINLRGATAGYINLRNAAVGDVDLQGATAGDIYLWHATAGTINFEGAKADNINLEGARTGDIKQKYTAEDLDFLRNLPLNLIDMRQWQSNYNWLTAKDIHNCGTTYCVRGYAEAQYFAKNGVKVEDKKSLYPNLKHLFHMSNEQFKAELNKILY